MIVQSGRNYFPETRAINFRKFKILCVLALALVLAACGLTQSHPVSEAIAEKVSSDENALIVVAELTDFEWDRLYVFDPYTPKDHIHKKLNQEFLKPWEMDFGVEETETLLVFTNRSKVVDYFFHNRDRGDFAGLKGPDWFTPDTAKFKIDYHAVSGSGKWPKMVIADEAKLLRIDIFKNAPVAQQDRAPDS